MFQPFVLTRNRHLQTLLAAFPSLRRPPTKPLVIELSDGDRLVLEISTPAQSQALVILVHGLGGSHTSPYMRRIAAKLYRHQYTVVRVNLRGAGSGLGLARKLAHSGRSEDVRALMVSLKQRFPNQPRLAVGFSLGGNILLKALAEMGQEAHDYLSSALALCPPIDLLTCVKYMKRQGKGFYDRYLVRQLTQRMHFYKRTFSEYAAIDLGPCDSLYDFDDRLTAPISGFRNADDYYRQSSAAFLLKEIALPTTVFYTLDDPFVDPQIFETDSAPSVDFIRSAHGGHLGCFGDRKTHSWFWLDRFIQHWVEQRLRGAALAK